jgi:hypothetical protein
MYILNLIRTVKNLFQIHQKALIIRTRRQRRNLHEAQRTSSHL